MPQVLRFQDKDAVLELFKSRGLTAVSVGPYLIGVADASALSSPEKLADYIRDNLGNRDNLIFFTKGRAAGTYNQVASHSEILSRAGRMEEEHMRIRTLSKEVPVREEQPIPVRTERRAPPAETTPRGRRRRRREEETPAEAPPEEAPAPDEGQQAPPAETPSEEEPTVAQPEEAPAPEEETPVAATPQTVAVGEAQSEKVSQINILFMMDIDGYALSNALMAIGMYDQARRAFSLGSTNISDWNMLTHCGISLKGVSSIVFNVDAMVQDGILTEGEAARLRSRGNLPLTLFGELISMIEGKGADPNKYAQIAGHEQLDVSSFHGAVEFLKKLVPKLAAGKAAILEEFSHRRKILQEMLLEYDSLLGQLGGKPPDEEVTVTTPSGAERSGKASDLVESFKEEKARAERELASLMRFISPASVDRIVGAEISASFL
jgi:hypothetical protein